MLLRREEVLFEEKAHAEGSLSAVSIKLTANALTFRRGERLCDHIILKLSPTILNDLRYSRITVRFLAENLTRHVGQVLRRGERTVHMLAYLMAVSFSETARCIVPWREQ